MPGPVSDAYHPEWGTCDNQDQIAEAIQEVYDKISAFLEFEPPIHIMNLVQSELPRLDRGIDALLSEREWRILRFACERARDSL